MEAFLKGPAGFAEKPVVHFFLRIITILAVAGSGAAGCKPPAKKSSQKDGARASGGQAGRSMDATSLGSPDRYLFNADAARTIAPLVDAYQKPGYKDDPETYSTEFGPFRTFTEKFLNDVMALEDLTPGRKIEVEVMDADYLNAFADGFQRVVVTLGALRAVEAVPMLAVVCHELAHSSKNHSQKRVAYEEIELKAETDVFYNEAEAYFGKTYDKAKKRYKHDLAAYTQVRKLWDALTPRLAEVSKRNESEADILGGMICGELGMPPDDYERGHREFMTLGDQLDAQGSKPGRIRSAADLKDGDVGQGTVADLFQLLFPRDSHPSNAERDAQLKRTRDVYAAHFDKTRQLYKDWLREYERTTKGMGLTGFDLRELSRAQSKSSIIFNGEAVEIFRPTSCGH